MAKKNIELQMKIAADVAEVKKATAEINKFKEKYSSTLSQIGAGMKLDIGAKLLNTLTRAPAIIQSSIDAYARQEGAEANLAAAIRATGASAGSTTEALKALAGNLQRITTYGDETTLEMQALAVSLGVPAGKMQDCIEGAIGLSKALKIELKQATIISAQVLQGKTEKLNEYLPALKNAETNAEKLAIAQMAMARGFSQAKAETETLAGAAKQCANIWGDNAELVGKSLAPAYKAFLQVATALGEFFNKNSAIITIITRGFVALAAAMSVAPVVKLINAEKSLAAQLNILRLRQAAYVIQAGKTNDATKAAILLKKADATASRIAAVSTRGLAGAVRTLYAALGPAGWAVLALTVAVEAVMYAYDRWQGCTEQQRESLQKTQTEIDNTAAKSKAFADSMALDVQKNGGKFLDLMDKVQLAYDRASAARAAAIDAKKNGFDTTALEREAAAHEAVGDDILRNIEKYQELHKARLKAAGDTLAAEKAALEAADESPEAKRARLAKEILKTKFELRNLEFAMRDAQENSDANAAEAAAKTYAEKRKSLATAEKEFKAVNATVEAEQKRAAAESARGAAESAKAAVFRQNWQMETEILKAKERGDKKAVEELENTRKTAEYKRQILDALRGQVSGAENLQRLENEAQAAAEKRVKLENDALCAEKARVDLKNREKGIEEYVWRIKIAQARLRGDEKTAKKLENLRDAEREADGLAARAGITKAQARQIVGTTRKAESAAAELQKKQTPAGESGRGSGFAGSSGGNLPDGWVSLTMRGNRKSENAPARSPKLSGNIASGLGAGSRFISPINAAIARPKTETPKNPANDAGGKIKDDTDAARTEILKKISEAVQKVMSDINSVKNNTATIATKEK